MHRIKIIILLICIPMTLWSQGIKTSEVDFPILNGKMTLRGVLSEPENTLPNAPLLVLVSPPQPINKDYSGFFKALSDTLNSYGFVTFRYDNRNFSDTINAKPNDERFTLHDGADDLHDAITFLKNQNRPIALIGHSEGGSISIVETARNADVKYLLLLATIGLPGEQFGYSQQISRLDFLSNRFTTQEINLLKYGIYYPLRILANNPDNEIAFSKLRAETRRFYEENKTRKLDKKNFSENFFGEVREENLVEKIVEKIVEKWEKDKRGLAFLRYNPADYFPTIKCPVFIAYAKDDNLMRYKENQENLERILMDNRHFDYHSIAIDSVYHSFEDSGGKYQPLMPNFVHIHRQNKNYQAGKGFSKLCKHIVEWIEDKNVKIPER
ncbi:MAG: alpha/beta fold hydrolase [Prevotella sp.]|nr:alpha/beta fold hydrolase [Prevotella sp.]